MPTKYRIKFHCFGCAGGLYFKIQRRGFLGRWWTIGKFLPILEANDSMAKLIQYDP